MVMFTDIQELLPRIRDFFLGRPDVDMAFLSGSLAKGQSGADSDIDNAIHFRQNEPVPAGENEQLFFEGEEEIWYQLERISGRQIDLIVLNRAPATVADSALRGIPIIIKDGNSHLSLLLRVTSEAIDFREWVEDYWRLKEKIGYVASSRV